MELKNINQDTFGKYGVILDHYKEGTAYEPVVTVKSNGWIWAILTYDWKSITEIEKHPT